jgi:hypothetical protein
MRGDRHWTEPVIVLTLIACVGVIAVLLIRRVM